MHLGHARPDSLDRIINCKRRVSVGGRVENDRIEDILRFLDPIHQYALMISLTHLNINTGLFTLRSAMRYKIGIRRGPVEIDLSASEQIEVGTVQNENLHRRTISIPLVSIEKS